MKTGETKKNSVKGKILKNFQGIFFFEEIGGYLKQG